METTRLVSTKTMSEISGISCGQLVRLRNYAPKESPPFLKLGRQIFYSVEAFDAWLSGRIASGAVR